MIICQLGLYIITVLVLGVFWKRGNNKAALATFAIGCGLGLVYFIMDMKSVGALFLDKPSGGFAGLVTAPAQGLGIPFMLAGPMLCAICIVTYIVVSLTSPPPSPGQLENACWGSPLKAVTETRISGVTDPRVVALVLFLVLCVLYLFLR